MLLLCPPQKSRACDRLQPVQGASASQGFSGRLKLLLKFRNGTHHLRGGGYLHYCYINIL